MQFAHYVIQIETLEHVGKCEKIKNNRDDWIKNLNKKLNDEVKKIKESTYERKIVNEIIKDFRNMFWTN